MKKEPGPALAKVGQLERRRHLWNGEHFLSRILHFATCLDRPKLAPKDESERLKR
jgi:hypothetical protein